MLEYLQKRTWIKIVFGVLMLAFGLVAAIMALTNCDPNLIPKVLFIILAVFLFLDSLFLILFSITKSPNKIFPIEIIVAGIFIAIGIIFCIPEYSTTLWPIMIKLLLFIFVTGGSIAVVKSIVLIIKKAGAAHWLPMMFFGLVFAAAGVLLLIFYGNIENIINSVIGLIIAVAGLVIAIFGIIETIKISKAKKAASQAK